MSNQSNRKVIIRKPHSNRLVKNKYNDVAIISEPIVQGWKWNSEINPGNKNTEIINRDYSKRKKTQRPENTSTTRKLTNVNPISTPIVNPIVNPITDDKKKTVISNRKTKKSIYPGFNTTQRLTATAVLNKKRIIIHTQELDEMIVEIVTKITMNKKIDKKTKDKRTTFFYKTKSCIEIIKNICEYKDWDILKEVILQKKYWDKFGSEFLQWDDLVQTLLKNISEDNYKLLFTPIVLFMNTHYINIKSDKNLENLLKDIEQYLENAVNTQNKKMESLYVSYLESIYFFTKNDEKSYYTTDLVETYLNNILGYIIRLNKSRKDVLYYVMSVMYKIIKYKYIKHDSNTFLDEQLVYNQRLAVWDIIMDDLNNDIDKFINAKKRNSNSINKTFFGLLDKYICENKMVNNRDDIEIMNKFPAIPYFINFFCRKRNEGKLKINTNAIILPQYNFEEEGTIPMRGK